jgi:hypothetical protein
MLQHRRNTRLYDRLAGVAVSRMSVLCPETDASSGLPLTPKRTSGPEYRRYPPVLTCSGGVLDFRMFLDNAGDFAVIENIRIDGIDRHGRAA